MMIVALIISGTNTIIIRSRQRTYLFDEQDRHAHPSSAASQGTHWNCRDRKLRQFSRSGAELLSGSEIERAGPRTDERQRRGISCQGYRGRGGVRRKRQKSRQGCCHGALGKPKQYASLC